MRTIEWTDRNFIRMIDQRQIPWSLSYVEYDDYREVAGAITDMVVRGAPAIGVAAAYGMALAAYQAPAMDVGSLLEYLDVAAVILKKARPTAVNLAWAVDHMLELARDEQFDRAGDIRAGLLEEARRMA
ncbi:MAG: S-methyl-5-thioribose-1-phosphate isomerase, partial [Chloroflexi bacterium]